MRVSERVCCVEDIFTTGQIALDLRIPESKLHASEEQEGAVGQRQVVGGPGHSHWLANERTGLGYSRSLLTERGTLLRAKGLQCACHQKIAQKS